MGPLSGIMEFSPWLLRLGTQEYSKWPYKKNVKSLAQLNATKKLQPHRPGLEQCPRVGVEVLCRCFSQNCNRIPQERWDSRAQGPVGQLGMRGRESW